MGRHKYNLGFISDELIFGHVKETVLRYKRAIDLKEFNLNLVDPIKLTFDAKVYGKTFEEIIESECIRQIDRSNVNQIGYFHQNLFKLVGHGWAVPDKGFDIVNEEKHIFVELKNKHNTMNAASSRDTYLVMQNKLLEDKLAICMLVEVIAKQSQNVIWEGTFKGQSLSNPNIRRLSIDKFYEMVFGVPNAFFKLCKALPLILDEVMKETPSIAVNNTVYEELKEISSDTFKSLYLLAFETYEGFYSFK